MVCEQDKLFVKKPKFQALVPYAKKFLSNGFSDTM